MPTYIIIKLLKNKDKILKIPGETTDYIQGINLNDSRSLIKRPEDKNILKVQKQKNCLPTTLYPAHISFRDEGKIKIVSNEKK